MARKHTKLGYSHSDVLDYRTWNEAAFARNSRRRPLFVHLDAAADYRRLAASPSAHSLTSFYRYEDHLRFAAGQIGKAREWRLEIGG